MNPLRKLWRRFSAFVADELWDLELSSVSMIRRQVLKLLRILHLTVNGFRKDELPLRASGLTLWTLLSLAPFLAFVFTVFRGLGRDTEMIERFSVGIAEMPQQVQDFLNNIITYVQNSSKVGLGGFAVAILLYTVIKVMGNIEHSFNRVYGLSTSRTLARKFTDYISILVLVPMLFLASGALAGFRSTSIWQNQPEIVHATYGKLLLMTPLFASWIAFTVLYLFMPNTRVKLLPAMLSALVGAVTWILWQKFYVVTQGWLFAGESKDKVFGAFAAVPIFMFWLYVCWMIVLFGVELAFAMQNSHTYAREQNAGKASEQSRQMLALALVARMAQAMIQEDQPLHTQCFAKENGVPIRLINDVLGVLIKAGLVGELSEERGEYVLLKAPDKLQAKTVIDRMEQSGAQPAGLGIRNLDENVNALWDRLDAGIEELTQDLTVEKLALGTEEPKGEGLKSILEKEAPVRTDEGN
jgi:membrane protein